MYIRHPEKILHRIDVKYALKMVVFLRKNHEIQRPKPYCKTLEIIIKSYIITFSKTCYTFVWKSAPIGALQFFGLKAGRGMPNESVFRPERNYCVSKGAIYIVKILNRTKFGRWGSVIP